MMQATRSGRTSRPTDVEVVKTFDIEAQPNGVVIIVPPDLESPQNIARLKRDRDFAEEIGRTADAFAWPKHGRKPVRIPFLVSANIGGYELPVDAAVTQREQKTLDYFGFNGAHDRILHGLWHMKQDSYCRPDIDLMRERVQQDVEAVQEIRPAAGGHRRLHADGRAHGPTGVVRGQRRGVPRAVPRVAARQVAPAGGPAGGELGRRAAGRRDRARCVPRAALLHAVVSHARPGRLHGRAAADPRGGLRADVADARQLQRRGGLSRQLLRPGRGLLRTARRRRSERDLGRGLGEQRFDVSVRRVQRGPDAGGGAEAGTDDRPLPDRARRTHAVGHQDQGHRRDGPRRADVDELLLRPGLGQSRRRPAVALAPVARRSPNSGPPTPRSRARSAPSKIGCSPRNPRRPKSPCSTVRRRTSGRWGQPGVRLRPHAHVAGADARPDAGGHRARARDRAARHLPGLLPLRPEPDAGGGGEAARVGRSRRHALADRRGGVA